MDHAAIRNQVSSPAEIAIGFALAIFGGRDNKTALKSATRTAKHMMPARMPALVRQIQ
jgi:hypothetical protein